jgi:4-alpha-glucanotransferase
LPGTTSQYPNWSRKMLCSIKELSEVREMSDCASMVASWIEATGRSLRHT